MQMRALPVHQHVEAWAMKQALQKQRPDLRGIIAFLTKTEKDVTLEELRGVLKWAWRLRLDCAKKQLPVARA
eukprot:6302758-Lingulodinium_polyedra.AAC.1